MSRHGFKILDSDTHVYEPSELLEQYLSAKWKRALEACQPPVLKIPIRGGLHMYGLGSRQTGQRRLGTREKATSPASSTTGSAGAGVPWGVHWKGPPWPSEQVNLRKRPCASYWSLRATKVSSSFSPTTCPKRGRRLPISKTRSCCRSCASLLRARRCWSCCVPMRVRCERAATMSSESPRSAGRIAPSVRSCSTTPSRPLPPGKLDCHRIGQDVGSSSWETCGADDDRSRPRNGHGMLP